MKKLLLFLSLTWLCHLTWTQNTVQYFSSDQNDAKGQIISARDTIIKNGNFRYIKCSNYAIDSTSKSDLPTVKSYIVQFKGDPLVKAAKTIYKTALLDKEAIFATFQADLNNIIQQSGNLKSASAKSSTINQRYTKAFYGASFELNSDLAEEVRNLPYVEALYENKTVKAFIVENTDPLNTNLVKLLAGNDGDSIKIGVIDTGIDYMHPALGGGIGSAYKVKGGWDFFNIDSDPRDDNGHGTHVAGIIAGDNDSLTGVAPHAFLYAYKVLGKDGWGYVDDIIAAIELCVDPNDDGNFDDRMDIVNMSLGSDNGQPDSPDAIAVNNAVEAGIVFCIAAGNSGEYGSKTIGSPGSAELAITVGASDNDGQVAYFSSRGPNNTDYNIKPEVLAPGVAIFSSVLDNKYEKYSGTSMATPYVTGVCALIKKIHPDWGPNEIKSAVMSTTTDLGLHVMEQGTGIVNTEKACNISTITYPASINFGMVDSMTGSWSKTKKLKLYNTNTALQHYTISWESNTPGVSLSVAPDTLDIGPGDSSEVEITITASDSIPFTKGKYFSYYGKLNIISQIDTTDVFWTVIKVKKLVIQFEKSFGDIWFGNEQYDFSKYSYNYLFGEDTSGTSEILIPDTSYYYAGTYHNEKKLQGVFYQEVLNPGPLDTLVISDNLVKNRISLNLKDEGGNDIDLYNIGNTEIAIDFGKYGGFAINILYPDEFWISNITNVSSITMGMFRSLPNHKVYCSNLKLNSILSDTVLFNRPEDFKLHPICINTPYYSSLSFHLFEYFYSMPFFWIMEKNVYYSSVQWPWNGTLYLSDNVNHEDNAFYSVFYSLYKQNKINYNTIPSAKCVALKAVADSVFSINTALPIKYEYDPFFFHNQKDKNTLMHVGNDTIVHTLANLNPVSKFFFNNDSMQGLDFLYRIFGSEGLEFYADPLYKSLKISDNAGNVINYNDDYGLYRVTLPEGEYTFEYAYDNDVPFSNKKLKNILTQQINTVKDDKIPANITTINILNHENENNPILYKDEQARLRFSTIDYEYRDTVFPVDSYVSKYTKPKQVDSIRIYIKPNSQVAWDRVNYDLLYTDYYAGKACMVDLSPYTSIADTYFDVKIEVIDQGGNKTTSEYIPCFVVYDAEVPGAVNDYYTTTINTPLEITPENTITTNDFSGSPVSSILYYNISAFTNKGQLEYDNYEENSFIYTPYTDFIGLDSAKYYLWNELFMNDSAYIIVNVTDYTSIEDLNNSKVVTIYPNPATDYIVFKLPKQTDFTSVELFDLQGRKVMTEPFDATYRISISKLNSGVYVFKLLGSSETTTGKIIIK